MPLRVPLAQQTTMGTLVGISCSRAPRFGSGILVVPGACPEANSCTERTSSNTAPLALSAGSIRATRRTFHHL